MKARTTGSIIAIAVAALGAFALVWCRSVSLEVVYPVENARRSVSTGVWSRVAGFFHGSAANAENIRLRREVAALSLLKSDIDRLEAENARLRRALGYVSATPEKWLAAGVLSRGGGAAGAHSTLRVDKGSLAGVKEGAVVAVPDGLVGRVSSVTPHTSEITLVTDPSLKVACEIESDSKVRIFGILSGGSGDLLVIRHLMNTDRLSPHARVLTSGRGGIFPHGLEIGTLLSVRKDSRGLAHEGEVLPQVAYSTLEDVFIRREK